MSPPINVCIDARLRDGEHGGVQQVVIGLSHGFKQLERHGDSGTVYHFLTWTGEDAWLRPHLPAGARILSCGAPAPNGGWRRLLRRVRLLQRLWRAIARAPGRLPDSDGTIERAGIDVMHFTHQSAFLTPVPSIYHPHDLQHLHLPEFFSERERRSRELAYRTFCERADTIAVASSWVKRDLIHHYGLPAEKVRVIPWAPPNEAYPEPGAEDIERTRAELNLPESFVFYPAQTWPHKNHIGLVRALAKLHEQGLAVSLVSSGRMTEHHQRISEEVRRLGLDDAVHFVGFVSPLQLQVLYRLCRAAVIPTKFEAASYPVWEAFLASAPVACSAVTSLPEQVGDAAITFDPDDPDAIADAVRRLWTDETLRSRLIARARERVSQLSWEQTARRFRAEYRRVAGRVLDVEDRALLEEPPLL